MNKGSAVDKYDLLPSFLQVRGLVKQHIDSYNHFVDFEIKKIIRANEKITSDVNPNYYIKFLDISIGTPSIYQDFKRTDTTPQQCRLQDLTYSAPITVDIEYTRGREIVTRRGVPIGYMPVMLRSSRCYLTGKSEELMKLGECPLDPGGYFVVRGVEKVILIQEQLSNNRIIVDSDQLLGVTASVTSSTHERKSKTTLLMNHDKIYVKMNVFTSNIPIVVFMKALGLESDQEIIQLIGKEQKLCEMMIPSLKECYELGIFTNLQALEYLESKVKTSTFYGKQYKSQLDEARDILNNVFLAHVRVQNYNFVPKQIYLALMVRRLLEGVLDKECIDDKDYVGNKRLELAGQLLALMFEDLFKRYSSELKIHVDKTLAKTRATDTDISKFLTSETIKQGLESAIASGNWTIKRFRMERKGVTQVVSRLSYIAALGHMTRISSQFEKARKVSGPRALQPSQFGMLCPCDTPEGEACGLVKNLALLTHITTPEEDAPLIALFNLLGVEEITLFSGEEMNASKNFLVLLNGAITGLHRRPQIFARCLRQLRRRGEIKEFVSVFVNEKQRCIYIASDGGRVCRPLVIADKGVSRVKEHHMKELKDGLRTFDDFLYDGLVEYLDVNEENNSLVALYENDATPETTHIEIEPFTILGVCAGLIPYPHHNQSPRNTYQCAMGKQAMGNIAYNQHERFDSLQYLQVYAQRPLLSTKTIELVNYDKLGAGTNATVAVMSYSGYDIEDATIFNKSSLDRGFGRCIVTKKFTIQLKKHGNATRDRIVSSAQDPHLDNDGIVSVGEAVRDRDILVNRETPKDTTSTVPNPENLPDSAYRRTAERYHGALEETGIVDKVLLTSNDSTSMLIKCKVRHTRTPELGDKFSSRHGQKGVIGLIVPQEDLPFSETGVCPDLIMNPHGYPSRMTVGKLIELIGSKAGVLDGRFHYGTAFGEPSGHADTVESICETLVKNGFSYSGKDFLYSGITGEPLQGYIFMGPIYYQKLKHMVIDKMHARGNGPVTKLTRQPVQGKSRQGGMRVGEMERDCLIAYGASQLVLERLMLSSDPFELQVCTKCGLLGYYNHRLKANFCSYCKNGENMATMKAPYACKLLLQELQSMNIVPRLQLVEA